MNYVKRFINKGYPDIRAYASSALDPLRVKQVARRVRDVGVWLATCVTRARGVALGVWHSARGLRGASEVGLRQLSHSLP